MKALTGNAAKVLGREYCEVTGLNDLLCSLHGAFDAHNETCRWVLKEIRAGNTDKAVKLLENAEERSAACMVEAGRIWHAVGDEAVDLFGLTCEDVCEDVIDAVETICDSPAIERAVAAARAAESAEDEAENAEPELDAA